MIIDPLNSLPVRREEAAEDDGRIMAQAAENYGILRVVLLRWQTASSRIGNNKN